MPIVLGVLVFRMEIVNASIGLAEKERELEALTLDLDDKTRVGQKGIDRPGSRSGRVGSFSDRPSSRSGSIDDSRRGIK
ncbi:hypothetical protein MLD38_003216 [Melastoma candidum]|uniref:Uncharacterized protein n=1 Tax=Melastoma candidum TaxID=119954 RepID=A0ACB9S6C8_9MYRT|nr:hypothetical protein MLD38_003216 [Melastoma candidum]